MKRSYSLIKVGLSLLAFAVLGLTNVATSNAATSAAIDIKVSINATKSLSIGSTVYNYGALSVNTSSVSSSILVTNDSGALVETYTLQGANAASTGGGTTWNIAASTGVIDEYVLAGQFSTAQPANSDAAWGSDAMTTSAVACTSTVFGNGVGGEAGSSVSPVGGSNTRNLWFRIITPLYVSDVTQRNATLTLAVQ